MNRPPTWSSREEALLLLNAYLDNELDAASVLDVERRIADDATLKAEYERLQHLRSALALHAKSARASDAFRARISAIADDAPPVSTVMPLRRPARASFDWWQLAAAVVMAACIGSGATYVALRQATPASEFAEIIGGHERALLAPEPFDIASSDRHTVKPWFDSKLALSPQIIDLASEGFPLAGGRVDVVDGKTVPVMVYKRRAHVISVVAIPKPGQQASDASAQRRTQDGYSVISWRDRDFTYSVVSDLAEIELDDFVSRWRAGISKG